MKALKFLSRAGFGFLAALMVSYFCAVNLFNVSGYKTNLDRFFLILVPALALGVLFFEASIPLGEWFGRRQPRMLVLSGTLAILGSAALVAPPAFSPLSLLGLTLCASVLFAVMLPVLPWLERFQERHSFKQYLTGFLFCLIFAYGSVGFLDEAFQTPFKLALFTFALVAPGSVAGYYLVRRVSGSIAGGFLRKPLNLILVLALPVLLIVLIQTSLQFPAMFIPGYITIPQDRMGMFLAGVLVAGVWGAGLLEQWEERGYYGRFARTKLHSFIKQNLPGLYAGGMFFLVNLIIARALNHPALSINSVLFETDAGPWMEILGSPAGDALNRSVHPMVLLIVRPLVRMVGILLGDQWHLAPILWAAALSGLCVFMAWLFVRRATSADTYSFIFAIFLGSTATHLLFGSLTETYVFGMTSLIFFFLLIQAGENRFSVLVPAGLLLFGITISNIAQGVIGLFFNGFGYRRLVRYGVLVLAAGITLTAVTSALYPHRQTFFFVPGDLAFETHFVKPVSDSPVHRLRDRVQLVARTMFLYDVVGPSPVEVISHKDPRPTIDFKTFEPDGRQFASYRGIANIPLVLWLLLLGGSFLVFVKNLRSSKYLPLMAGLLGSLAFNFLLHMVYGTELFLYTPYWMYLLVFFIALALSEFADRKWFEIVLAMITILLMVNNLGFISGIMRGLAPFYGPL
ncbi:MAG: hypothetical protein K8S20_07125 [Chloroflexi bacterium]|nr:hypothetical protein [Chloroflexota bacterium]